MTLPDTPLQVQAEVLLDEARRTGLVDRHREIVARFDRLAQTAIPRRALLVAVSGKVERDHAIAAVEAWHKKRRRGVLVLSGLVGTGKTVAAAWYACRSGAEWCSAPLLGLGAFSRARADVEALRRADALVIDEVGGQGSVEAPAVARLSTLLSLRHGDMRPTVITTNLDRDDFAKVYDGVEDWRRSRLVDRIVEGGGWITTAGPSRRGNAVEGSEDRIDASRYLCQVVEQVESIATGQTVLNAANLVETLRVQMRIDVARLSSMVREAQAGRERIEGMLAEIKQATAPARPEPLEQRRQALRKQVEGVEGEGA